MPTTPHGLVFSKAMTIIIDSNTTTSPAFTVPSDCIWKIESAGLAETNGVIYLMQGSDKIVMLATSIDDNDYAALLPFWLEASFTGAFRNESNGKGSVSITEYVITP